MQVRSFRFIKARNQFNFFFRMFFLFFAGFEQEQRRIRELDCVLKAKEAGKYKGKKSIITNKLKQEVLSLYFMRKYNKKDIALSLNNSRSTLYTVLKPVNHE